MVPGVGPRKSHMFVNVMQLITRGPELFSEEVRAAFRSLR